MATVIAYFSNGPLEGKYLEIRTRTYRYAVSQRNSVHEHSPLSDFDPYRHLVYEEQENLYVDIHKNIIIRKFSIIDWRV